MKGPLGVTALAIACLTLLIVPALFWALSDDHNLGDFTAEIPEKEIPSYLADLKKRTGLIDVPATAKDMRILTLGSVLHTSSVLVNFKVSDSEFKQWTAQLPPAFFEAKHPQHLGFPGYSEPEIPSGRYFYGKLLDTAYVQMNF